ncbi:MAG: TIGR04211 family SH3 domain-containing protein [Deltaproteobacteria bacterium]|nr:TIGR04211 family SH3 domain-containing protein [Deltaproteobacteria bacterium]
MRKKIMLGLCAFILLTPALCPAGTMFLTDRLEVAVRAGKGLEYKILAIVKSNQKVEVVETEGEYANIKLASGIEGWILNRYLTRETPKPTVIERLNKKIERLQAKDTRLAEDMRGLKETRSELEKTKSTQAERIKALERDYEDLKSACADFIKLQDDHDRLKQEMIDNRRELSKLRRENEELRKNTNLMWFVVGASAVLIGFIIGLVLQGLRSKRRKQLSF